MYAAILFVDRITKYYVLKNYVDNSLVIIKDVFSITLVYNRGAGFGTFQNSAFFLTVFSASVLMICLYYYVERKETTLKVILSVMMAGISGNMLDRVLYGKVVDFLNFKFWPVFNVADIAITIGILSLIIYLWATDKDMKGKKAKKGLFSF